VEAVNALKMRAEVASIGVKVCKADGLVAVSSSWRTMGITLEVDDMVVLVVVWDLSGWRVCCMFSCCNRAEIET